MILQEQYALAAESRAALFEYCSQIAPKDFLAENSSFGRGSIRNLLVHIANTYQFWIGKHALEKEMEFTAYDAVNSMEEMVSLFEEVDMLVTEFLHLLETKSMTEIEIKLAGKKRKVTLLRLFTHVVTHEFHHKGQVLSLSRHLGYTPVDTDVMR